MPKQFEQLEKMERKANLNERQKEYLEKLKAELEQISAGYNAEELAERGDIRSLEMFVEKKREIIEFLENKQETMSKERLISWARLELGKKAEDAEEWIDENFDLQNPNKIVVHGDLDLSNITSHHFSFPENLIIEGDLIFNMGKSSGTMKDWVRQNLMKDFPKSEKLTVLGNVFAVNFDENFIKQARKLKEEGKIKGEIIV